MLVELIVYPPYERTAGGRRLTVELPPGSNVRDLLKRINIGDSYQRPDRIETDDDLYRSVMPHRSNRLLKLADLLADGDIISLLPPMGGGVD
jgi:molybdopterin converting factor small subunit